MDERSGQVDLNLASVDALIELSGIGPVLAQRIVAARPFADVEDLLRVQGIGPDTLERLRPFIGVSADPGGPEATGADREGEPEEDELAFLEPAARSGGIVPLPEEGAGAEGATVELQAKAPETVPLSRHEDEQAEEADKMQEHETVLEGDQGKAAQAEGVEAQVVEAEDVEAQVVEAEGAEAQVVEAEDVEAQVVKADVVEGEFVEQEAAPWEEEPIPGWDDETLIPEEDILFEDQEIPFEDQDIPIPDEAIPAVEAARAAEAAPERKPPAVTRARVGWMALLSIVLATLLGTLLSRAILSYV